MSLQDAWGSSRSGQLWMSVVPAGRPSGVSVSCAIGSAPVLLRVASRGVPDTARPIAGGVKESEPTSSPPPPQPFRTVAASRAKAMGWNVWVMA